jgi:DNA-directed RNA polymerase subunit RPC12/RpoP
VPYGCVYGTITGPANRGYVALVAGGMIARMNNTNNDGPDVLSVFAGLGFFAFLILLVVWGVLGTIAWFVAPEDRRWTFVGLTLLFGPLGVLAAAVASPRDPSWFAALLADALDEALTDALDEALKRPRAKGRERYWCSRCGAQSDLAEVKGSECWRCGEKRFIAASS